MNTSYKAIFNYSLLILLYSVNANISSYQNSSTVIYDASFYKITKFYSVDRANSYDKYVFIQLGVNYNPNIHDTNLSGSILRYDKALNVWYHPFNRFIRAVWCSWPTPYHLYCNPRTTFAMSQLDTLAVIVNGYSYCGGIDGSEGIYQTENGGLNYQNSYNEYLGGTGCRGLDIVTYLPGLSEFFSAIKPINSMYTVIFGNGSRLDSLLNIRSAYSGGFLKINPFNEAYFYIVGDSTMFLSSTYGTNFFRINVPPFKKMVFSKHNSTILGITHNQIYRSVNMGLNWSSINFNDSLFSVDFSPINRNAVYAGGNNGLYLSTNGGNSFNLYNNTFSPSTKVIGITKDSTNGDTVIVCTDQKVYKVWASEIINSVIQLSGDIPEKFSLSQNYPNPFNPTTQIKFDVPKSSFIKLTIYDAMGREISVLVNENLQAGSYSVDWDASAYSNGVYFYTITAGEYVQTKKMVLIK